ncbi:MAG: Ig-like domain-containing protein [Vicinamibacterales bacterium]
MRNQALVLLLALAIAAPVMAQVAMPDAGQMSGVPLPAGDLPNATVSVRVVRERMGNNISGQAVTLSGAGLTKSAVTDAQGRAQFADFAAGTTVTAEAVVDGEKLTSQAFPVPAKGGVRVALVAGATKAAAAEKAAADAAAKEPARSGVVEFGGDSRVILEYQNDTLQVFYILDILNNARTPIDVGGPLQIDLPQGASGGAVLEGSSPQASVRGERVTITGPFAPGKTSVQIGFALPNAGADYDFIQKWPAALDQVFVAIEKIGPMQLSSPQLKDTRDTNAEGQTYIMGTGPRLNAGDTMVLHLTGLPARSPNPRYAVIGLALVIVAVGLWFGLKPAGPESSEAAKLTERRERLMRELVSLERRRSAKPLPAADEARRVKLIADLERVLAGLDHTPGPGDEGLAA